jgi:hypothetical protein
MQCPHGTVTETASSLTVSCDLTWNPFDNRKTTPEEREEMELF